MEHQELLSGLVGLHVLHHAAEGDLYGNWMIEELARHGYQCNPLPMPHALERKCYLTSRVERAGRSQRRIYRATDYGVKALALARDRIRELVRWVAPGSKRGMR